jgi:hypothetical protein
MKTNRRYITPMEAFKYFGLEMPEWITFNPKLTKRNGAQYDIIRQTTHDGTLIFEKELIGKTIENLANKSSFCKIDNQEGVIDRKYEVGYISIATVFEIVELPIGKYPGEKQRARLPVKCTVVRA